MSSFLAEAVGEGKHVLSLVGPASLVRGKDGEVKALMR
jgi:hypothetical protein